MVLPIGLAPSAKAAAPMRGSVAAFSAAPQQDQQWPPFEGMVRATFEGDPKIPEEWGQVSKWMLKMPPRVQESLGCEITGEYQAVGLVEGHQTPTDKR